MLQVACSDVELLRWSKELPCCCISSFLSLPGAFIFIGKPRAGTAGNKKMKVVQGISPPLPALLLPALLPALPQPGMPGDAGAGGGRCCQAVAGKWGGHQHGPAPPHAESCGTHLGTRSQGTGGFWCLLSSSRNSCGKGPWEWQAGGTSSSQGWALHSPGCRHELLWLCYPKEPGSPPKQGKR